MQLLRDNLTLWTSDMQVNPCVLLLIGLFCLSFVIVWLIPFLLTSLLQDDGADEIKEPSKADNE